jgi:predicted unusual protein kinase regulating ubiquinone biosynthesis (AarF/ABC1/UbiB family)
MPKRPPTPVPQTRLGRLAQIGLAAGELAFGAAAQGLTRLAKGQAPDFAGAMLSGSNAKRLASRLSELRGAAMKLGQILSLHGEEMLPPEFVQALAELRSQATSMPTQQLHRVLGREYGKGWEKRFTRFDEEPIAAASIGQVHRAVTRDGRDLALKIQYPGVARSIASDVDNVAVLLRLFNLLPVSIDIAATVEEAKRQFAQEADYEAEGRFLESYAKFVADEPGVIVPHLHWDFTTPRIMAMDYMEGVPLEKVAHELPRVRDTVGSVLERLLFRELFEFRVMQTDPNFANYLFQRATGRVVLLDFGATRRFDDDFVATFARITRAVVKGDRELVAREAARIGYVRPDDGPEHVSAAVELIFLVCEPLQHTGPYDFSASDLLPRVRARGYELAVRRGLLRAPPPATMFLHRKLIGSFLLLARIGAKVDARALVLECLKKAPRRPGVAS